MVFSYLYELHDKDEQIFYVGTTTAPKARYYEHLSVYGEGTKLEVISKDEHKEINTINEYLNAGIQLTNKEKCSNYQSNYEIGDVLPDKILLEKQDKKENMSKNEDKKLTSVKIDPQLWDLFKIECIKRKFSFQKLSERAIDLYMKDEDFRRKVTNHSV